MLISISGLIADNVDDHDVNVDKRHDGGHLAGVVLQRLGGMFWRQLHCKVGETVQDHFKS